MGALPSHPNPGGGRAARSDFSAAGSDCWAGRAVAEAVLMAQGDAMVGARKCHVSLTVSLGAGTESRCA